MRRLAARLRQAVALEVENRPDYLRRRGRIADLTVGPILFHADTTDEGSVGFRIALPGSKAREGVYLEWGATGYPRRWAGLR